MAKSEAELEEILARIDSKGGGEFWFSHSGPGEYPAMLIQCSRDLATIFWFPQEGNPGFRCFRTSSDPVMPGEFTTFLWDGSDPGTGEEVPNEFVVKRSTAIAVAKEFLLSPSLPAGFSWMEL